MTMRTSLAVMFTRRLGLAMTKRSTAVALKSKMPILSSMHQQQCRFFTTRKYDGHLTPEQMQTLDDFVERVEKLEADVQEIRSQISNPSPTFGVDAPDGDSDADIADKRAYVNNIIDTASKREDASQIHQKHKLQQQGVDGPDGESNLDTEELKKLMNNIIDQAAKTENTAKIMEKHAQQQRGVDSPDGDSDGSTEELKQLMNSIIDQAAQHEDTAKIMEKHAQQQYGVDSPDGDSDGYKQELKRVVNSIIDDTSKTENTVKINSKHKLQQDVKAYHARDPEHDW